MLLLMIIRIRIRIIILILENENNNKNNIMIKRRIEGFRYIVSTQFDYVLDVNNIQVKVDNIIIRKDDGTKKYSR